VGKNEDKKFYMRDCKDDEAKKVSAITHRKRTHLQKDPNTCAETSDWPSNEDKEQDPKDREDDVLGHDGPLSDRTRQTNSASPIGTRKSKKVAYHWMKVG
jgi:hypothetical protein